MLRQWMCFSCLPWGNLILRKENVDGVSTKSAKVKSQMRKTAKWQLFSNMSSTQPSLSMLFLSSPKRLRQQRQKNAFPKNSKEECEVGFFDLGIGRRLQDSSKLNKRNPCARYYWYSVVLSEKNSKQTKPERTLSNSMRGLSLSCKNVSWREKVAAG